MAPFEALYDRRCRSPVGLFHAFRVRPKGVDIVRDILDKANLIQESLLTTQSRQKSCTNRII